MARHAKTNLTLVVLNAIAAAALLLVIWRHHCRRSVTELYHAAGLDRTVTNLKMDGMPLRDVLNELHRQTGAEFVLSPSIAGRVAPRFYRIVDTDPGWQTPIWGSFHHAKLSDVLDALCRHATCAAPLHYDVLPDGRILIGADDEIPQIVRTYDVRNLTSLMSNSQTDSIIKSIPSQEGPVSQFRTVLLPTDSNRDGIRIDPQWWLVNGRLVVVASRRAQTRIAAQLDPLRDVRESFPAGSPLVTRNVVDLRGSW